MVYDKVVIVGMRKILLLLIAIISYRQKNKFKTSEDENSLYYDINLISVIFYHIIELTPIILRVYHITML